MDTSAIGHGKKKLCACAGVREGYDAPVQAPARPAQLSSVKHTCFDAKPECFDAKPLCFDAKPQSFDVKPQF